MEKNFGGQVSETRTILHFGFKHKLESGENTEQKVSLHLDHWQTRFHYRGEVMAKYDTAPYLVGRGVRRVHMNCWVGVNESLPLDHTQVNSKKYLGNIYNVIEHILGDKLGTLGSFFNFLKNKTHSPPSRLTVLLRNDDFQMKNDNIRQRETQYWIFPNPSQYHTITFHIRMWFLWLFNNKVPIQYIETY